MFLRENVTEFENRRVCIQPSFEMPSSGLTERTIRLAVPFI